MIGRLADWEARLAAVLDAHRAMPPCDFWAGRHCLALAADAAEAVTGQDPRAGEPLVFANAREAYRALNAKGFADLGELLAAYFAEVPPSFAHRGDLAVIDNGDGTLACGVIIGANVAVKDPEQGLAVVDRARAVRAFSLDAFRPSLVDDAADVDDVWRCPECGDAGCDCECVDGDDELQD